MDENPNLESFSRNLSMIATLALVVHISWTSSSPGDHFPAWLVSTIPPTLTGFFLLVLLFNVANETRDTQFFTLLATSTRSGLAGFRVSRNPGREDRHFFNVLVIAYTASFGVSIDLIYGWYLLCDATWSDFAKREPISLLVLVTLSTGILGLCLLITWMPVYHLVGIRQNCGGKLCTEASEDGDGDPSPRLQTLIAAAEAYENDLRSQRKLSYDKNDKLEIVGAILGTLRKW